MKNILHAQDAWMYGNEKFQRWMAEFEARWNEPEAQMAADMWARIPEPYKAQMRQLLDPELLNVLEAGYGNDMDRQSN